MNGSSFCSSDTDSHLQRYIPVHSRLLQSSLMNYSSGIVLGNFFRRNRYHCVARSRPQRTPQRDTACSRFIYWKDSGHAYHFPFHYRYLPCCRRGIDPLVVFSHPWSFLHIRAQCSQGTPACHDWTIRDHPAPSLHGNYYAVHWRADLVWITVFMAQRLRGFREYPRTESVCADMAGRKKHRWGRPPA